MPLSDRLHLCAPFDSLWVGPDEDSHALVERERAAVDRLLDGENSPRIYGFTTLLGHLDDQNSTAESQNRLLDAHLVGIPFELPVAWERLVLACKLTQLSAGGSGVHPSTYRRLGEILASGTEHDYVVSGAWTSSYGSGDVVPGAWFVDNLCRSHGLTLSHPGDLITLINGNFISTAIALLVQSDFVRVARESMQLLTSVGDFLNSSQAGRSVQLSVTMRDLQPLQTSLEHTIGQLCAALDDRLHTHSCNPRFLVSESRIEYLSQSSFLDFTLTGALSVATQAAQQIAVYLKGSIRLRESLAPADEMSPIQPTKVAQALIAGLANSDPSASAGFSISESNGVEDVCDLGLASALNLLRVTSGLKRVLSIAQSEAARMGVRADYVDLPECCEKAIRDWEVEATLAALSQQLV